MKLYDSELKIMEVLWEEGDLSAGQLAKILKERIGWNRNTTYTIIKKLIMKEAVERIDPGFICKALVSKEEVRKQEMGELIDKLFEGSPELFASSFFRSGKLSKEEMNSLKQIIDDLE